MGNQFVALPAPTGNGDGAAVDVSSFGSLKTVICGGVQRAQITVEVNNAVVSTDGSWAPVASFQNTGQWTGRVAARWMRVRVTGYNPYYGGTPQVELGGTDSGALFASLIAPVGDGAGPSVDVSALGVFKSVQVGAAFRGTTIIEVSEDGSEWAQPFSFQTPGVQNGIIAAHFMRVRRVGVPDIMPGLPIVNVGATNDFAGAGDLAISAGTQSVETGTVVLGNSNGLSFGMQGSSLITASMDALRSVIAAGSTATGPTLSIANSNGVTFGMAGQTLTASVAAGGGIALAAGTQTATSGTGVFSNSNGVSFGMAGSSQVTASVAAIKTITAGTTNVVGPGVSFGNGSGVSFGANGSTITASVAAETPFGVSAGTQSVSTGTINFANSNGITFGMSGSNQITASVAANASFAEFNNWVGQSTAFLAVNNSSLFFSPRSLPNVTFAQLNEMFIVIDASNSTGTGSYTQHFGVYTRNAASLSLLASTSFSISIGMSGTVNSTLYGNVRLVTTPWATSFSRGDYWLGILQVSTSSSQNVPIRPAAYATSNNSVNGLMNVASNATVQPTLGLGRFSAVTAALPAAVGFSDIQGSLSQILAFGFGSTV